MNQPNHALPRAGKPIFIQTKIELETEKRRQLKNIYQAEEPVAVGTTLGLKCVWSPIWILSTNMRLQKAFDSIMHPFGFCNGNIPFSNMETRDVIFYAIFVYRVIMYRPHWKQFRNFFLFQISQRQLNYFSFLFITLTTYLLRIQLSDTLRTLYICILTLKRDPRNLQ